MGGFTGDAENIFTVLLPQPQDLDQQINGEDSYVRRSREFADMDPKSATLMLPIWKFYSVFHDLQREAARCMDMMMFLGDLTCEEGCSKWPCCNCSNRSPNPNPNPYVGPNIREQLSQVKTRILPGLRLLVRKIDKLYDKVTMDVQLYKKYPHVYARSPYFTPLISCQVYRGILIEVRNEIVHSWNDIRLFTIDMEKKLCNCSAPRARLSWKKILVSACVGTALVVIMGSTLRLTTSKMNFYCPK